MTILNQNFRPTLLALLAGTTLIFTACDKDDTPAGSGQLQMEITDGPTDDPNVKGVFVTIAEVKVDGQTFAGFTGKRTVNLTTLQQGNVELLGLGDLNAGSYQNITLVLDHQTDATGGTPGCYVLTSDNVKHVLSASAGQSLTVLKNFSVTDGGTTSLVIDFDLRKAVQYQNSGADKYDFVSTADLQSALRVVLKSNAGVIYGECQNPLVSADKIVVYAYKKGTFNRDLEVQAQNGVAFKNAVTSTLVNSNGEFKLAFLESGDYELHLAAYKDTNSDGKLDLQGTLLIDNLVNLENIRLDASAEVHLSIVVTGLLP